MPAMRRLGAIRWVDDEGHGHARNLLADALSRRFVDDGESLIPYHRFSMSPEVGGHVIHYGWVAGYEPASPGCRGILLRGTDEVPGADARVMIDPAYVDAVLVDLDGTLVDSGWVWRRVAREFLSRRGIPWSEGYADHLSRLGFLEGLRHTRDEFSLPESVNDIRLEWREITNRLYADEVEPFDGALECVGRLRAAGIPVALVTMSTKDTLDGLSTRLGISESFDAVVTKEPWMSGEGKLEAFVAGCERLGLGLGEDGMPESPGRVVAVEDSPLSLEAARSAGLATVGHLVSEKPLEGLTAGGQTVEGESLATFANWSEVGIA